ncbi:MAG TPA: MopE-related protein [Saprospiraceae bacterium]|nr:MopE-related protein [Saprospiraceae bacterium]HPI07950.1 MopE-related protein [Saprospiraceae bacterium]
MIKKLLPLFFLSLAVLSVSAQQSVARRWNEALLNAIRKDFARPPVHARNLYHVSMAMYDAWAAFDSTADTYLLGKTVGNYTCVFEGINMPADIHAAQEEAMSYAVYRVLLQRFQFSPNAAVTLTQFRDLMIELGYDPDYTSVDYAGTNSPAALGNYIGYSIVFMGLQDGSNEQYIYASFNYAPVNPTLVPTNPGNPNIFDPNRWQPLTLNGAIDQNGNPIPSMQIFQSPEWGKVQPFALTEEDRNIYNRNGVDYWVYHDPGPPPALDTSVATGNSDELKWGYSLVSAWQSHMDTADHVLWDISPRSLGNVQTYPQTLEEYHDFYNFVDGGDTGTGREINPKTGLPYEPQIVPRADYTRALAEFWADGPNSETPPGHWFAIFNHVMDHPQFVRRYNGQGPVLDALEYDVKAYFTLGGSVHDAAVSAWGIKGWYDSGRPITTLRYMADKGQSSDPDLPSYHPAGLKLIPGFIELVAEGDTLAGPDNKNVGKIKMYTWRGHPYIPNPAVNNAGVGWILAENWWPYQRKTFVTPPFAGYISGHSTYSRAAAETLTLLTGDEYFPGGMGEFHIGANLFIAAEIGPSVDVTLQWATYRDASDQTSLSRIWGGIHPPFDDIPGRVVGAEVGQDAFYKARTYFYKDEDADGFYSYEDCDDLNAEIHPGALELCDGIDNDCNGLTDDNITIYAYYPDMDGDGFGDVSGRVDTCLSEVPQGFVTNGQDCDDTNIAMYPTAVEYCDGIDNNCNGLVDDNIPMYSYYADTDNDGFGDAEAIALDTCLNIAPAGFVINNLDCNDSDSTSNPNALEICDGVDNNCNGLADDALEIFTYYTDNDADGYGDGTSALDTCLIDAPAGYALNALDCNDNAVSAYPGAPEIMDGIDNDCNGLIDDIVGIFSPNGVNTRLIAYPNPAFNALTLVLDYQGDKTFMISSLDGKTWINTLVTFVNGTARMDISGLAPGVYILHCACDANERITPLKIVKM